MAETYLIYGVPASYYTGKVRAYLRKQGIDFEERSSAHPDYGTVILPATQRVILPVMQTPSGEIVQDSDDIIAWFETRGLYRQSAHPPGPRQRVLSHLFNLYGSEGLTRMAMHYRWSLLARQDSFIAAGFAQGIAPESPPEEAAAFARPMMQRLAGYLPALGITAETAPLIEDAYHELLDLMQAHLQTYPCLFGAWPSLGDYGLYGALFAHLGRDPVPAFEMKTRADRVFRWTERLSAPNLDIPEYPSTKPGFAADDVMPETLDALCRFIASEFLPELQAQVAFLNDWLQSNPVSEGDPVTDKPHKRAIGRTVTRYRGVEVEVAVSPYRIHMLQAVTDVLAALGAQDQASVRTYFDRVGLGPLLALAPARRVERINNLEVWGKAL